MVMVWCVRCKLKKMDSIQNTIELVGKIPKMDDKWQVRKQQLVEALTFKCHQIPCHPCIDHGSKHIVVERGNS